MPDYVDSGYVADGYIGQPGSGVMFRLGANTITFRSAPVYPHTSLEIIQPEGRSTGAVRFPLVQVRKDDIIEPIMRLTEFEKGLLLDFFINAALGMVNPFDFVQVDGSALTVRFNQSQITFEERAYNAYICRLALRVQ